jgi:hypothetical protein
MLIRIATIFILSLALIGCAKNPVTGRSQFMLVSEEKAISASSEAYVKMLAPLDEEGKIDSDRLWRRESIRSPLSSLPRQFSSGLKQKAGIGGSK